MNFIFISSSIKFSVSIAEKGKRTREQNFKRISTKYQGRLDQQAHKQLPSSNKLK